MRSDIGNANTQTKLTTQKVEVHNGSSWLELTNLDGYNRVNGLSYTGSRESGRWSATLRIVNTQNYRDDSKSLDPGHTSDYNPSSVPLLGAYHDVRITLAKGGAEGVTYYGHIGPGSMSPGEHFEGADYFDVPCVGVMQPYYDYFFDKEEGRTYSDTTISAATNACNTILTDYGFAADVVLEDDPAYTLYHYEIGQTNLGEAITRPVNAIGYVLEEKYDATSGEFKPTIVDPSRSNTTPDVSLNASSIQTDYTEANVRTWIKWSTRDRTTGSQIHVIVKDDTAKGTYGIPDGSGGRLHRKMYVVEQDKSTIDTEAELLNAAEKALHDLSTPAVGATVTIPWACLGLELGDLVRITTHSETVDICVTNLTIGIASPDDQLGSTQFSGVIGRRVGRIAYWQAKGRQDWVGQKDRDRERVYGPIPNPPTEIDSVGAFGQNEDGSSAPKLHVSWHGRVDPRIRAYRVRSMELTQEETGTATSGTTTVLTDTAKSWTAHEYRGMYLYAKGSGRKGSDEIRRIIDNDATTITVDEAFTTAISAEDYAVMSSAGDWQYRTVENYQHIQLTGSPEGTYILSQIAVIPNGR